MPQFTCGLVVAGFSPNGISYDRRSCRDDSKTGTYSSRRGCWGCCSRFSFTAAFGTQIRVHEQRTLANRRSPAALISCVLQSKFPVPILQEGMVGATGFEPVTTRTPSVCATRLRYAPTAVLSCRKCNTTPWLNQFNRPNRNPSNRSLSVFRCAVFVVQRSR
jgi:hypothetical protein